MSRLDALDWHKGRHGLLPAIVQHADTGKVLMLGYMNAEALAHTRSTGLVTFFSRSREALWTKGETSGNYLELQAIQADCDRDTLLVQALPRGPVCHLGTETCFDGTDAGEHRATAPRDEASAEAAAATSPAALDTTVLDQLQSIIAERAEALASGGEAAAERSYVAKLLARGPAKAAQKVGEEGVEVALAVVAESDEALIGEAADLLFHLLVALRSRGLSLTPVLAELERRRRS
jgi:phosphoribosyl-ATP pyrophosphohydrolase/phosphoribosyl-AMP cyclohydrolase